MKCECEAPGFCPRRNCEVGPARWRLCQIPLPEHAPPQRPANIGHNAQEQRKAEPVSQIGTRLEQSFKTHLGATSPCGECRAAIQRLDNLTPAEVLADIDNIVSDIASRAGAKAPTWWMRMAVHADSLLGTGQTERWIRERILEIVQPAVMSGSKDLHFLYFYIAAPDNGMELKHSIRSITQNYAGRAQITIIGDKPPWYTGHHIPVSRYTMPGRGASNNAIRSWHDTRHKIILASNHPELPETFCWIMDDVYFLRPVSGTDILTPRYDPYYRPMSGRGWHKLIQATFRALTAKGYPNLQYGTHLPHVFEKQKLQQVISEFNLPNNLLLFEILYGNRFRENAISYEGFLKRLLAPQTKQQLDRIDASVLNYVSAVWRPVMRTWIQNKFPDPSPYEI